MVVFSVLGHEAVVDVVAHRRPDTDLVPGRSVDILHRRLVPEM